MCSCVLIVAWLRVSAVVRLPKSVSHCVLIVAWLRTSTVVRLPKSVSHCVLIVAWLRTSTVVRLLESVSHVNKQFSKKTLSSAEVPCVFSRGAGKQARAINIGGLGKRMVSARRSLGRWKEARGTSLRFLTLPMIPRAPCFLFLSPFLLFLSKPLTE